MLSGSDTPIYLVLDGHPAHRSTATREFAASTDGRLRLVFLPGYSPELNPDEWVWKTIKADRVGRIGVTNKTDLVTTALHRLQKLPDIVRGFFRDPNLAYITA
ncbi:transposase [Nocardia sp. NPDC051911]|uniref:transposase n=1 Tax=Nocardia sp. NPDC051911 TaxID=3154648 RepID=UPI003437ACB8